MAKPSFMLAEDPPKAYLSATVALTLSSTIFSSTNCIGVFFLGNPDVAPTLPPPSAALLVPRDVLVITDPRASPPPVLGAARSLRVSGLSRSDRSIDVPITIPPKSPVDMIGVESGCGRGREGMRKKESKKCRNGFLGVSLHVI